MPHSRFATIAVLAACLHMAFTATTGAASPAWDLGSDTWVATDALGRSLPDHKTCGPVREGRFVGIFYWTWHIHHAVRGPFDNTKIIAANPDDPQWGPIGAAHHWGEPELGYYVTTDPYVLRRHASTLADAGVDVVLFDTTNPPFTFKESYMALCEVYRAMRQEGNRTPQIAFLAPFGDPTTVVNAVYEDLYSKGLYEELWFRWEGKPLIMADPAWFKDEGIRDFFTFRKPIPSYFTGPTGPDQWGWLEVYPQHIFRDSQGNAEQVTVGVAQNAVGTELSAMSHHDGAMGRSWHDGRKDPDPRAILYGRNFEEQWRRALEIDPEFIFITGWNEWVAGRFTQWYKYTGKDSYYPDALFVDQYNHEYSRDVEPMKGGHTDNYYYQMVGWIRQYKGVGPSPAPAGPSRIRIDGDFSDWTGVAPEYRDTLGDTAHRDHRGYGDTHYTNTTGRNDIVACKMAWDQNHLYAYARVREPLTASTDANWMLLLLDIDADPATGWQGYDWIVNEEVVDSDTTTLKKIGPDWKLGEASHIQYRCQGSELEIAIPWKHLGGKPVSRLDFHWADNIQHDNDIIEFAVSGDSAPNRRFNYRYTAEAAAVH